MVTRRRQFGGWRPGRPGHRRPPPRRWGPLMPPLRVLQDKLAYSGGRGRGPGRFSRGVCSGWRSAAEWAGAIDHRSIAGMIRQGGQGSLKQAGGGWSAGAFLGGGEGDVSRRRSGARRWWPGRGRRCTGGEAGDGQDGCPPLYFCRVGFPVWATSQPRRRCPARRRATGDGGVGSVSQYRSARCGRRGARGRMLV